GLTVAFTLASIIGLVFMLVYACIFTKVLVTNKRIIGVIDMFVKKFHFEILLSQITSTEIKQNFLGKLFNYGSVTVYTSNGKDSFTVIKPFEFQNRIENRG
ncbi:PH domain-containing protein, partial [Desulfurella amilsii]